MLPLQKPPAPNAPAPLPTRPDPQPCVVSCRMPCPVFLERQFAEFANGSADDAKMVDILRKTWKKMGDKGRQEALGLPLGPKEAALVGRALAPDPPAAAAPGPDTPS